MKLSSTSITQNAMIPETNALGKQSAEGPVPSANKSPQLSWADFPEATKSFVILACDPDVPASAEDVNQSDRSVKYDFPRIDFYHWVLVDIPVSITSLEEGQDADGLKVGGKKPGTVAYGVRGLNDYTGWFSGDADMEGNYAGYDGPWPPFNDERIHHYNFTVFALNCESIGLDGLFDGRDVVTALEGKVIDQATLTGTYTLNLNL
ncbi:MAG: YbhB/YbcL family Raf kinase inhibitor-like protein [Lentisphaeria bacterium]|nr:YbhB/YbcL family Raf kinase inhibitor-like protein [Lentisphaeria bacterium]